jgi:type IV pilus assembly protein PilY1
MKKFFSLFILCLLIFSGKSSADMNSYCATPPFISSTASPLVLFVMGRDHKIYYEAYNDASDLDGDGELDTTYKHSIQYYGYFDSHKCYTYSTGDNRYNPSRETDDMYCGGSGEWSGNFLNWLSMSRIDVMRKVLYGGKRFDDNENYTILGGAYIPRDAHSWGKEYYAADTRQLTPFNAPPNTQCTLPDDPAEWSTEGNILYVDYQDGEGKGCGDNHANLLNTFSPGDFHQSKYVTSIDYNDSEQSNEVDNGNLMFVTKIDVPENRTGSWYFRVHTDDGGEVEVDGVVVATHYGCHDWVEGDEGTINLTEGLHTIIVRVREQGGNDGARLYYRVPGSSTDRMFSESNLSEDGVNLYAPSLSGASGACSLKTSEFITTGIPSSGGGIIVNVSERHLFCMSSDSANSTHLIKVALSDSHRIWDWASTEKPVCNDSTVSPDYKYYTRVKVCDSSVGEEDNCYDYDSGSKKPTGLLQRYGTGDGTMVCSKTNIVTSGSCTSAEGIKVAESPMYFGLITGSYTKNLSGGVLRKNITSISEEINADGTFITDIPANGSIIQTMDKMQIVDYNYGSDEYSSCGWITTRPLNEGECKMWGNPLGEMFWESLRYFAGETSPTSGFTYSGSSTATDGGLSLPNPGWRYKPYETYPSCSRPYVILFSDVNPSYDNDAVPSSGTLEDYNLSNLYDEIDDTEGISGNYFIGENGVSNDFICSSKTLSSLGSALGLCPEEPTKKGTFNTSALAYYGRTDFKNNFETAGAGKELETYSVALASPLPEININVGGKTVKLVPIGKSVGGSHGLYDGCFNKCSFQSNYDADEFGLTFAGCSSIAFCPSNTIVDFYVDYIGEDSGQFRINYEDVEQGADHDMDAIARYHYQVLDDSHVQITLESEYAAGSIDQVMGFVLTGTTEDGVYLPIRDIGATDTSGFMPVSWTKTLTVDPDASDTEMLHDPLWYAAKYGGFNDYNANSVPDLQAEWDENGDGTPDNYELVINPLELEEKFAQVFTNIMKETSSGTSVSILSERKSKGSIMSQAVFYPEKDFGGTSQINNIDWIGQLFGYWFYNTSEEQNIREDTNSNYRLDICDASDDGGDNILDFRTDASGSLQIDKYSSKCTGKKNSIVETDSSIDDIAYLWEAGSKLASMSSSSRYILTNSDNGSVTFSTDNKEDFQSLLGSTASFPSCLGGSVDNLISFIRGDAVAGCRTRTLPDGSTYKLGDIIYSTPTIVNYNDYSMVYTGANDGMLHAFRAGKVLNSGLKSFQAAKLCNDKNNCSTGSLGQEEWGFIPKNALPYLRYLADPDYSSCHLYYADLSPYILEVDDNNDGYVEKRILIGGMRLGGAQCGCTDNSCINPPSDTCPDTASDSCVGRSAYYALDVTDPDNPTFLWEFTDKYLGFSYSGPAIIKKGSSRFVVFLSGPTNYDGMAEQALSVYVLKMTSSYGIDSITKFGEHDGFTHKPTLSSFNKAFGGRLFSEGVDYGGDGNTDTLFFGVNSMTGNTGNPNWAGNVLGIHIVSEDPLAWEFGKIFNSAQKPITTKIEHMKCFNMNYLYFGTGRWFYKTDEAGGNNEHNNLYGVRIDGCTDGNCNLNSAHSNSADTCSDLTSGVDKTAWTIPLAEYSGSYLMERLISDPTVADGSDAVFFSTTEPSSDICSFGGRSRLWGANCATGGAIDDGCSSGSYTPDEFTSTVFLQLSRGNIEDIGTDDFTEEGGRSTQWYIGITPETGPVVSPGYSGSTKGKILFWIEK